MSGRNPAVEGPARGRPPITSRDQVARVALTLFIERGFEETTMADIAVAVGVGRRTLFRYFPSKNDVVWGDFDRVLDRLGQELSRALPGERMMETLARAVVESNRYEGDALEDLRLRMRLITSVPALQAHSMMRYGKWRHVVSAFVADRLSQKPDDLTPALAGNMALGASMAAFTRWVLYPDEDLLEHLRVAYARLARAFDDLAAWGRPRESPRPRRSGGRGQARR